VRDRLGREREALRPLPAVLPATCIRDTVRIKQVLRGKLQNKSLLSSVKVRTSRCDHRDLSRSHSRCGRRFTYCRARTRLWQARSDSGPASFQRSADIQAPCSCALKSFVTAAFITRCNRCSAVTLKTTRLAPENGSCALSRYLKTTRWKTYAGINGVYDFRDGSQRGITANAAVVVNGIPIVIRGPASAERAVTRENRSCLSPNACSAPERGRHRLEGRHLSRSCQERGDGVYSRQVKGFTNDETGTTICPAGARVPAVEHASHIP
jgi:hypothetical protein